MITYNPKDWFKLIIQFHKSDTFRQLIPAMVGIGIYAAIVVSFENHILGWNMKNPTVIHSILGFVLSMLLVFRTNTAYDRWWEGRKIWGSIVNNSRNLALKLSVFIPKEHIAEREDIKILISNYVLATKNHLRGNYRQDEFQVTTTLTLDHFADASHRPNTIMQQLYLLVNNLYVKKIITGDQLIVINEELKSFTDNCGACERIKNTPIPYSYNIFLKKMIFIYVITLPIMFGTEFKFSTVPITILILYVFASIELIAEEIEDPFGEDANDLPLDDICQRIKHSLQDILK